MAPKDKDAVAVTAPSEDPKDAKKEEPKEDTLSEEDKDLKERLETCVSSLCDGTLETPLRLQALSMIVTELRTATSSMTSVPKPLKFLRPLYPTLQACHKDLTNKPLKARLGDVLSVLAMTLSTKESLEYKLEAVKDYGSSEKETLGSWGHEYVRSLAGELGRAYNDRVVEGADPHDDSAFQDLLSMVYEIVPFHMTHNAEAEAIDLLIEVQRLRFLLTLDEMDNYPRICLYLVKTADFMADPEDYKVCVERRMVPEETTDGVSTTLPRKCSRRPTKSSSDTGSMSMPSGSRSRWTIPMSSRSSLPRAKTPCFGSRCASCSAGTRSTTLSRTT